MSLDNIPWKCAYIVVWHNHYIVLAETASKICMLWYTNIHMGLKLCVSCVWNECDYVLLCTEENNYKPSFYANCFGTYSPQTLLILNLYCIMLSYKRIYSIYVIVLYLSLIFRTTFTFCFQCTAHLHFK